ncbi:ABC transporter, partial [human gut metagenome]
RNLDYENYSQQRQTSFEKQTKDAKKEREEYQKENVPICREDF